MKAYYDGSGSSSDPSTPRVTLAGYAGNPEAWERFEAKWPAVLRGNSERPTCRYLHMTELTTRRDEFAGWTDGQCSALLKDVYRCLYSLAWTPENNFRALICTVDLGDYERACRVIADLRELSPEAICTDHVCDWAIRMIPNDESTLTGKAGSVEFVFDQNEPFRRTLMPRWTTKWPRRERLFKCIAAITEADMSQTPGLQAADYVAWHTNRYRSRDDMYAQMVRSLSSNPYEVFYGYEALIDTYRKGWRR